jgi:DNA invertase Pin-like site-specific DNA recombinase
MSAYYNFVQAVFDLGVNEIHKLARENRWYIVESDICNERYKSSHKHSLFLLCVSLRKLEILDYLVNNFKFEHDILHLALKYTEDTSVLIFLFNHVGIGIHGITDHTLVQCAKKIILEYTGMESILPIEILEIILSYI